MSDKSKQKNLPLLRNHLLNGIFNNPQGLKLPIKAAIKELSDHHNEYTLLVPPAGVLSDKVDVSGMKLRELCYNNDVFVKSHLIKTSSPFSTTIAPVTKIQSIIYNTMNGRQVLFKNGMILTGKGFKHSFTARVLSTSYFIPFCDYFPTGAKIMVLYIDIPLYGVHDDSPTLPRNQPAFAQKKLPQASPEITFEKLLRNFTVLSKAVSDRFYTLFHHNNPKYNHLRTRKVIDVNLVKEDFTKMVDEAFKIVQDSVNDDSAEGDKIYNLLHNITTQLPGVDLNRLLHEYVELNIYDRLWLQLVFQMAQQVDDNDKSNLLLSPALYRDLSCLSLTQLDLPVEEPWYMNELHARVARAISVFYGLSDPGVTNRRRKLQIIKDTMDILTDGYTASELSQGKKPDLELVIDADTLVGLLVMVVVHSKLPNLKAHLYYISNFGYMNHLFEDGSAGATEENSGYYNYILSNIDAVIYHLSGEGADASDGDDMPTHLLEMSNFSAQNYELWYTIQKGDVDGLNLILDSVEEQYGDKELPKNHFLKSKNIHGESCFNFAVRSRSAETATTLFRRTAKWFSIEDILFDKNTTTDQTLLMVALLREVPATTAALHQIIVDSATNEERLLYYGLKDKNGRTIGHYLSHDLDIMKEVGPWIAWDVKDNYSHTPLYSICRCYDHSNYVSMVKTAFLCVYKRYPGRLTFEEHTDTAGNTLLHVLAQGIHETGILDEEKALVDVNRFNDKLLTPLAVYLRYGRTENLRNILRDRRFIFDVEDPKNFYNILDYYGFSAAKALNGSNQDFHETEKIIIDKYFETHFPGDNNVNIGVLNARYDGNSGDWLINVVQRENDQYKVAYIPLNKLRQFVKLQKMAFPQGFGPDPSVFWQNFPHDITTIPSCTKFRCNRLLENLTLYFVASNSLSDFSRSKFSRNITLCCHESSTLTLDMVKDITRAQEKAKIRYSETKLTTQSVEEIWYFLDYSMKDLLNFKMQVSRLTQLFTVGGFKQSDLRSVMDEFLCLFCPELVSCLAQHEFRGIDSPYLKVREYFFWLEMSVVELLKGCNRLKDKLRNWNHTYMQIKGLNAEIHRFEDQVVQNRNSGEGHNENNDTQSISRRSTTSLEPIPSAESDEEDKSIFNFGLIENRRSRYKKLVTSKAEEVKKIMSLNAEIKMDHELIASEISQFLSFRSVFVTVAIKHSSEASLRSLRFRKLELEKLLELHRKK